MNDELSREEMRRQVAERAAGCCEYCRSQARFCPDPFPLDHIIPRSKGGGDTLDNLAHCCHGCNGHKLDRISARDPVTQHEVPLFHPRRHRWTDHFAWDSGFRLIIGITPTGRATVVALHLNRDGVVQLREALAKLGLHPPVESGRFKPSQPKSNGMGSGPAE